MKKYCLLLLMLHCSLHGAIQQPEVKTEPLRLIVDTAQIEIMAREISQTLKVWDANGKFLDIDTTAVYQNILYNTLMGKNAWIEQFGMGDVCSITRLFLQSEDLKKIAAAPLILLGNELANKGYCLAEFLPLCLQNLDTIDETTYGLILNLLSQFVSNNIGITELAHIVRTGQASNDYSTQKRVLAVYFPLCLHETYRAEAIDLALKRIESHDEEIHKRAFGIFTNLVLNKVSLPSNIVSFLINSKKCNHRDLFTAQGRYLDQCFDLLKKRQVNKKLNIDDLPALVYLLLNNHKMDEVKALGRAAIFHSKSLTVNGSDESCAIYFEDQFCDLLELESLANQDYKAWAKAIDACDESDGSLTDYIDVIKVFNALFNKDGDSLKQIKAFIDEIRAACIKAGIDQKLASDLFSKFYSK